MYLTRSAIAVLKVLGFNKSQWLNILSIREKLEIQLNFDTLCNAIQKLYEQGYIATKLKDSQAVYQFAKDYIEPPKINYERPPIKPKNESKNVLSNKLTSLANRKEYKRPPVNPKSKTGHIKFSKKEDLRNLQIAIRDWFIENPKPISVDELNAVLFNSEINKDRLFKTMHDMYWFLECKKMPKPNERYKITYFYLKT